MLSSNVHLELSLYFEGVFCDSQTVTLIQFWARVVSGQLFLIWKHLPVLEMQFAPNKIVLLHFIGAIAPWRCDLMHNNAGMFIDNFCRLGWKNSFNRLTLLYL